MLTINIWNINGRSSTAGGSRNQNAGAFLFLKGTPQLGAKRELERGTNYNDTELKRRMITDSRAGGRRRIPRL